VLWSLPYPRVSHTHLKGGGGQRESSGRPYLDLELLVPFLPLQLLQSLEFLCLCQRRYLRRPVSVRSNTNKLKVPSVVRRRACVQGGSPSPPPQKRLLLPWWFNAHHLRRRHLPRRERVEFGRT
jgi:hypothetical protein